MYNEGFCFVYLQDNTGGGLLAWIEIIIGGSTWVFTWQNISLVRIIIVSYNNIRKNPQKVIY